MFKRIKNILITWDAIWSIPLTGILLLASTMLAYWINPQADLWGLNQVQDIFVSTFKLVIGSFLAQCGLAINLFLFFGYRISQFKNDFNNLQSWQKLSAVVACYLCYLLAFALLQP